MKNQRETIRKVVTWLNNEEKDGGFWLPNIQRPFVWHEDQIERLFDSVMREYPISTLLVWKTKSRIRRRKFIDNYRQGLKLSHYYVPENDGTKLLVLDGQQRLQSLFIGLRGSYDKKELYFDVLSGEAAAPDDIRYRFRFFDPSIAVFPWVRFKRIVFSNEAPHKLAVEIAQESPEELNESSNERLIDNLWRAAKVFAQEDRLAYQELDSVDNPDLYTEDDVVEIFIRANSGGTKLGKSDLLFSLLTSSWEDADERMELLLEELNQSGYDFTRDFILKTCLTLLDKGPRYDVAKFRDGKTKEEIIEGWEALQNSIKDVRDFLYGKTFIRTDRAMPSYLALIPLIYFRYHFADKWKRATNLDTYILRTLLTGAFSGTPDNLIDRCTKQIAEARNFDYRELFGIIRADGRSLDVNRDTILNLSYGSKEIHMIFNLWYKDFNYQPTYQNSLPQVDHIFPQSLLKRVKDMNPDSGKRNLLRYRSDMRDQIANCMLLTAEENGAGGKRDTPPTEWFADKSASYLDMHLIPRDSALWELERFKDFLEERKRLIVEKFSHMIQAEG
tara:strand:- start:5957 stop:7633 length:1677 start_codon:yes stop_codon:yes gene_type:complete